MNEKWLNLDGAVVVVTGGASGIGKHVVDTLVKVGAQAVVVDMNVQTGDQMDGAYCVQCNVTDAASVQAMADAVVEKFGRMRWSTMQASTCRGCSSMSRAKSRSMN